MPKGATLPGTGILASVGPTLEAIKQDIAERSTEDLKTELARLLGFSAENLLRLAVVVNELECRGEDLKGLRLGLLPLLRLIAAGKLLPEVVVVFAGEPGVIKQIATLPLEEQREIVERGSLPEPPRANYPSKRRLAFPKESKSLAGNPLEVAVNGHPADVAEMVATLIIRNPKPDEVFHKLLVLIEQETIGPASKRAVSAALAVLKKLGARYA